MIPTPTNRVTTQAGSIASAAFEISNQDGAHIMGILREGLYTDRPLAVLREYSANAWDAHRMVGKGDVPIKVTLPTYDDPTLRIRDFGPGLSHEDVFTVYTQYGRSTKRESDVAVGMLGIGSKAAFSYTTSFTITSWHGGMRRVYVADLGDDDCGKISLVHEAPCLNADETGVEIMVATQPGDKWEFESTARKLFQHFEPRPDINLTLPDAPDERTVLPSGVIYPESGEWIAIMGCVPYRVNMEKLDARLINPALAHMSGRLTFQIGEVQMSASREELKYNAQTKQAIVDRANALVDEFVTHALKELESGGVTGWKARLQVRVLRQLELPLPDEWKELGEAYAKVTYDGTGITIVHNKSNCTRLIVEDGTRLLLDDTGRDLSGYSLHSDDYVVRSTTGATPAELRIVLDAVLAEAGLTGVKIDLLSTLHWTPGKVVPQRGAKNPKHRAQMFTLADGPLPKRKKPKSENWDAVTRVPAPDDVFVIIESFVALHSDTFVADEQFWHDVHADRQLCAALGADFPVIYGYKTTDKRPVKADACVGTTYRAWRDGFFRALMTPERRAQVEMVWVSESGVDEPSSSQFDFLKEHLGDAHPIVALFATVREADRKIAETGTDREAIENLARRCELKKPEGNLGDAVFAPYPLLRRHRIRSLWNQSYYDSDRDGERLEWVEYVNLVDASTAVAPSNVVALRSVP